MLIGVYVSNLSFVLLFSICLCIDTRQGCTKSWCAWTLSIQKTIGKRKKHKVVTPRQAFFPYGVGQKENNLF